MFEGTPNQMFESLKKFSDLPEETKVFCAHEYTLSNLKFALEVEPNNNDLLNYYKKVTKLRKSEKISLPSTIDLEKKINPFLRTSIDQIVINAQNYTHKNDLNSLEVLTAIREWKDNY